jgi:ATP phosphoribosyltransferase
MPDSTEQPNREAIRLALPKGRMQEAVVRLLADAGVGVSLGSREYRPMVSLGNAAVEAKLLKPQNIIEMLDLGSRDVGFAGADWARELGADIVEVLDTGLDPVRLVAAAPRVWVETRGGDGGALSSTRSLIVASEYERLTTDWIANKKLSARFVKSYGATEVFPPEDADLIVDITASGATLAANGLAVLAELMSSTTRLYASRAAMESPDKRTEIERLALLLRAVLEARRRVMLEVNVTPDRLDAVIRALPCMREPTIAPLHGDAGYAVKAAVPRDQLARLIPELKARGGTDIVVTATAQIVP